MTNTYSGTHNHVFLGEGHTQNERRTWMVIGLCSVMMVAEIVGGVLFGSIALVADGLHMSTHALRCYSRHSRIVSPGGMPTIGASASEPASWAIWRDLPAPSCWP
jgi:hypothetical protein